MTALREALKPVLLEYLLGRIDTEQAITKILEVLALHGRLRQYDWRGEDTKQPNNQGG